MLVYSCRSLIEASRTCLNDLASASVNSIAQLGALGLQACRNLRLHHTQHVVSLRLRKAWGTVVLPVRTRTWR